ncbi:MAG TPA: protein kinase [Pyrinomonadaceae bacterium]|nr:protein kinase [Pyrinomonadaceae bacterium]
MPPQLTSGTKLERYEILSLLGEGGMGEVYRARDVKLKRDVAIKVLPAAFSADTDRLRRFEQEAHAAGSLNHPNILAVYDVGAHEGAPYIVSELLEGETLREMLSKGALPQRKAIQYATMMAHGLAAAHERGIIHRDLKPENIFITKDDRVKILDFGLAKLIPSGGDDIVRSDIETIKAHTSAGTVMGTAGYMSPEQVRGQPLDARSDIFSFGAVIYEALAGRRAFHGDSAVESLNAILKEEPPELNETDVRINPQLEKIVRRCLEKKPERRFHSAHDLSFALETLTSSSDPSSKNETVLSTSATVNDSRELAFFRNSRVAWAIAGILALGTFTIAALYFLRKPNTETRTIKLLVLPPEKTFLMAGQPPVISPDGKTLAFIAMDVSGTAFIYIRPLDSLVARPLEGSDGAYLPFWSPDSRSLGFFAKGKLKRADLAGGQPTTLANAPNARGGTWSRNGVIIYCPVPPSPLLRISASGGESTPINSDNMMQGGASRWLPSFLPDGRHYLYVARMAGSEREVRVGILDSNESKTLLNASSNAVYAPPGFLLYRRESTLVAHQFDAEKLELRGEPIPIAEDVGFDATSYQGYFSASEDGVIVHHSGSAGLTQLTWQDRTGKQLGIIGEPADQGDLELSPDDNRLAFRRVDNRMGSISLWLIDIARGVPSRFTFEKTTDFSPIWSPDGSRIVFSSLRDGPPNLYQKVSSSAGNDEPLVKSLIAKISFDWSRDGRYILYGVVDPKTSWDLWTLSVDDPSKPVPFLQTNFDERGAKFSPNGRWVAYESNESGANEVCVRAFPPTAGKWQISTSGGEQPRWRRNGKELFYISSDRKLMSVEVNTDGSTFEHRTPTVLFGTRVGGIDTPGDYYAVTADGERFILNNLVAEAAYTPITVVLNWTAELKR